MLHCALFLFMWRAFGVKMIKIKFSLKPEFFSEVFERIPFFPFSMKLMRIFSFANNGLNGERENFRSLTVIKVCMSRVYRPPMLNSGGL